MSRNVVLVCLDSVRKDYFDKFAQQLSSRAEISYSECRAASSWSAPSHASILTGVLPHQHGVHTHDPSFESVSIEETFLANLPDYSVVGASSNVYASSSFGFAQFFDEFSDVAPYRRFRGGMDIQYFLRYTESDGINRWLKFILKSLRHENTVRSIANGLTVKVEDIFRDLPVAKPFDDGYSIVARETKRFFNSSSEPLFGFLNIMDTHGPFQHTRGYRSEIHDAPNNWNSDEIDLWEVNEHGPSRVSEGDINNYRDLYGAAIDYTDRKLAALIDHIQSTTDRETTFVITADHGENLGYESDNGLIGHTSSLSEGLLHVPLEIINPPSTSDVHDYDRLVSHLDLGELLVGLAQGELPDISRPVAVAELAGISQTSADPPNYDYWDRAQRCAYRDEQKIVWDSLSKCIEYEINRTRTNWQKEIGERNNPPEWVDSYFESDIHQFKQDSAKEAEENNMDEKTAERLEDLGYL